MENNKIIDFKQVAKAKGDSVDLFTLKEELELFEEFKLCTPNPLKPLGVCYTFKFVGVSTTPPAIVFSNWPDTDTVTATLANIDHIKRRETPPGQYGYVIVCTDYSSIKTTGEATPVEYELICI